MTKWRDDFNIIYKIVKSYCFIDDKTIADTIKVSSDAVRQYSGKRKTMPDNIDSLGELFLTEINKLDDKDKKILLDDIHKSLHRPLENVNCKEIGQYICTMIKQFYHNEKSKIPYPNETANQHAPIGHIQAVVFDFDGTLTTAKIRTTWESLWATLGYNVQECRDLHSQFDKGIISHSEWCAITAEKFIARGLTRKTVLELAGKTRLITGCRETLKILKDRNIKLYIVSGSIKDIIEKVLGNAYSYFTEISANEFVFDTQTSVLTRIIGTEYDFEGKANYINYVADRLQISPSDILFVGNSNNDVWAYQSGAKTLCVNPAMTNYHDSIVWKDAIVECQNLKEILRYVT